MGYFHACCAGVECCEFDVFSLVCSWSHASKGDIGVWKMFFGVGDDG